MIFVGVKVIKVMNKSNSVYFTSYKILLNIKIAARKSKCNTALALFEYVVEDDGCKDRAKFVDGN